MFRRIWTLIIARNKEFYRDRSALIWNFLFPFLILIGFSVMFDEREKDLYKVGVVGRAVPEAIAADDGLSRERYALFLKSPYIEFIEFNSKEKALEKLQHHRIDLLLEPKEKDYWVSSSSPKGYVVEKLLHANAVPPPGGFTRQSIVGRDIPYTEWLFPGILGMNMMFSALFGVGFVVVRYRKNGALKRMSVTPLKAWEFLVAQVLSRMFLLLFSMLIVFVGCQLIFGFECQGSYVSLVIIFTLGGFSLVSIGLLVASRSSSEEFASGMLNLISWPMMLLCEVWFSLEGAHPWVQQISKALPLTHLVDGTRRIMNDGAGLYELRTQLLFLLGTSVIFIVLGASLFKWQKT